MIAQKSYQQLRHNSPAGIVTLTLLVPWQTPEPMHIMQFSLAYEKRVLTHISETKSEQIQSQGITLNLHKFAKTLACTASSCEGGDCYLTETNMLDMDKY